MTKKRSQLLLGAAAKQVFLGLSGAVLVGVVFVAGPILHAQDTTAGNTPDPPRILQFLNQTIEWYRQNNLLQQAVTEPSDAADMSDSRQVVPQVAGLAFDFARAEADSGVGNNPGAGDQTQSGGPSQGAALAQMEAKIDKDIQDTLAEQNADRRQAENAIGDKRRELQSQVSELQGELDLANARKQAVHSMIEFVNGAGANGGATGFRAQIEALAASVPGAAQTGQGNTPKDQSVAVPTTEKPEPSGLWNLTVDLFSLSSKVRNIDAAVKSTNRLAQSAKEVRTPLIQRLTDLSKQGDQLAQAADTANSATLAQQKQQLDDLAGQFKQVSAAVIPLSKQDVLLSRYQASLADWRSSVRGHFIDELEGLAARVVFLAFILGIMFAAAEAWRRAIYRYVHEQRRRYQFLLLRKFVLWFAVSVVIASSFASRLGSMITFAGLLTAGIAVALQNVIVAVVGYFFLIGRFGIRIGDRVQIGGVTGEVIEVGLVRLHLMELGGPGADVPTGRVVAFSNSVAFQSSAGLFRQIPGTSFVWHEITLQLALDTEYGAVKERLLGAVEGALVEYRGELERQHQAMENTFDSISVDSFKPTIHLHYTPVGLEATIRFPVDTQRAAEIDEHVMSEVRKALGQEPKLKLADSSPSSVKLTTGTISGAAAS